MLINFDEFRIRLKSSGLKVFRDKAPKNTAFPYLVYSSGNVSEVWGSSKSGATLCEYQISLFTTGTEQELLPINRLLNDIPHQPWRSQQADENDDTITNFFTFVRVLVDE